MKLTVTSSPHIRGDFRTSRLMLDVVIALLPSLAVGAVVLGIRALLVALISVAAALATEVLYHAVLKKRNTWGSRFLLPYDFALSVLFKIFVGLAEVVVAKESLIGRKG